MFNYRSTEQSALLELLSKFTADYTRLLTENGDRQQLDKLEKEIIEIQKEVRQRKKLSEYTDASKDYISFNDSDVV